jgi:hypothetical protein
MSEEKDIENEKVEELKAKIHEGLVASLSFAEVVQVMNGMLVKESQQRVENMSEDELSQAISELEQTASENTTA